MKRNYDTIAWFYDRLAKLIYGKTLIDAQVYLLKAIRPDARVLIAGGGTGWILEEIARIHSSGLDITYVDVSGKMIALAQKRNAGNNKVTFLNVPVQELAAGYVFDIVITPFLLDNFTDEGVRQTFIALNGLLVNKGSWLYCDFQNTTVWWQKAVLSIMYVFFRSFCDVDASHLPDADLCFEQNGYRVKEEKLFLKGFIASRIYEKGARIAIVFAAVRH